MAAPKHKNKRFGVQYNLVGVSVTKPNIHPDPGGIPEKFVGVNCHWSGNSKLDADTSIITVVLAFKFQFSGHPLLDFEITNDYKVKKDTPGTKSSPKHLNIPGEFVMHIVEMSISHARGIQAYFTKGTYLEGLFIPVEPKVTEAASPSK